MLGQSDRETWGGGERLCKGEEGTCSGTVREKKRREGAERASKGHAWAAARFIASSSLTSKMRGVNRGPKSFFVLAASSSLRTLPYTWNPFWQSVFAISQPMPELTPVTTTLRSPDGIPACAYSPIIFNMIRHKEGQCSTNNVLPIQQS